MLRTHLEILLMKNKKDTNFYFYYNRYNKLISNFSWLAFEKVFRLSVIFFISIWVVRYLGPEQFGILSYAKSIIAIFSVFSVHKIDNIVIQQLLEKKIKTPQLLGTTITLRIFGSIFTYFLLYIFITIVPHSKQEILLILTISSSFLFTCLSPLDFYNQAKVKSKYTVYSSILSSTFSSLIKVYLILYNMDLIYFAIVISIESFFNSLGLLFFYQKKFSQKIKDLTYDHQITKFLIKRGWPLVLSSLIISIYIQTDHIMVQNILSNEDLGYYAAATRITDIWNVFPVIICSTLYPSLISLNIKNKDAYTKKLQHLYDILLYLSFFGAITMTFFGDLIILNLFGQDYSKSIDVFIIHIWTSVIVFSAAITSKWVSIEKVEKLNLFSTLIGVFFNIIFNIFFIKKWGIKGAASATLVARILSVYLGALFFKELRVPVTFIHNSIKKPFKYIKSLL